MCPAEKLLPLEGGIGPKSEGVETSGRTALMSPSPLRRAVTILQSVHTICCAAANWGPNPVPHERCDARVRRPSFLD